MLVRKKPVEVEAFQFTDEKAPPVGVFAVPNKGWCIQTKEGVMWCPLGYWVITGVEGEKYSCAPEIFDKTYDIITDPPAVLLFDTETNGLPKNYKEKPSPGNNWPRMLQLAWIVFDRHGTKLWEKSFIIEPIGFTINPNAAKVHKITEERAAKEGVHLETVLREFAKDWKQCTDIVAHNMAFDGPVVASEQMRMAMYDVNQRKAFHCTMKGSTKICKIPGQYGYKWPTLPELHTHLFGLGFDEAHDALVDVRALARCFWELKNKRKIQMSKAFGEAAT